MSKLFEQFSSKENLKKAYVYVQHELATSSLSVNPINHPATTAVNDLGDHFFTSLEKHLREGTYKPERGFFVYIPKDNLGLRPVCVLSMIDRIVFQAIFNPLILGYKVDGQLSDKVCFANRVNDDEESEYYLSAYFNGWDDFCKEQKKAFDKGYTWKLEIDVQQYYEHIPVDKLIGKMKEEFGIKDEQVLQILKDQLCTWAEYPSLPKGIPQGPNSSSILGNVYLSSLDAFAEEELIGKGLRYFRYADDIALMGKTKEDILKATEKIVRFLRDHNLTVNEKTRVAELEDTDTIEAMRFFAEYDEDTPEIPEDEFARVQATVPFIVEAIAAGEKIEKTDLRELKYFLKVDTTYSSSFILQLIDLIPIKPSLTVPIVQYVSDGRKFLDDFDKAVTDFCLWKIYNDSTISEWSKFWIFKLLVSENTDVEGLEEEIERILSSKEDTIFKVVCLYYQIIHGKDLDVTQVKKAVEDSKTDVEKSLYSFFLLNAFANARTPLIKNSIEKLLNCTSHELNLMGAYLFKNKPKINVDEPEGDFASYLLDKPKSKKKTTKKEPEEEFYMVRSENLIPVTSPSTILGVKRTFKKKLPDLSFPEVVQWEKVTLKLKEGLEDLEIWYDSNHIETLDYTSLGFSATKKEHKPNRAWHFLCILSVLQNEDIRTATVDNLMTMLAKKANKSIGRSNVHQTKRHLVKALRILFKTSDDPFLPNQKHYEPKFKVLPEAILRTKEVWRQGGKLNENVDYAEVEE